MREAAEVKRKEDADVNLNEKEKPTRHYSMLALALNILQSVLILYTIHFSWHTRSHPANGYSIVRNMAFIIFIIVGWLHVTIVTE